MKRWMRAGIGVGVMGMAAAVAGAGPVAAQEVELGGEVRPRSEVRTEVANEGGDGTLELTTMRARASVSARLAGGVRAFVQLQDVRTWGSESSTTDPRADALDLHQGWVELGDPETGAWSLKAGRQELSYGGQRLIGALNWAQQGRSFDGVRLRVRPVAALTVDGVAMRLAEDDVGLPDAGLYGVYGTLAAAGSLEGYLLYNHAGPGPLLPPDVVPVEQYTVGGRWAGAWGGVTWRVEAAYQGGERGEETVSASLVGARVGTGLGEAAEASVGYDRLSGDDDPLDGESRVFDTLFATNHKFYGFMDLFLDIPRDTGLRGLEDVMVKGRYRPVETVSVGADVHAFRLASASGLSTGRLGEELDLTVSWGYAPGVSVTGGAAWFTPADAWSAALGHTAEDRLWGYVMLDVVF